MSDPRAHRRTDTLPQTTPRPRPRFRVRRRRAGALVALILTVAVSSWAIGHRDGSIARGVDNATEVAAMHRAGASPAERLRAQIRRERRDLRAARRDAARWRAAVQSDPEVTNGIRLAAQAYSVDPGWLLSIAKCESGYQPGATNGRYVGLMQFGTPLWSTTPFAAWDRTDPFASALAAAWAINRGLASHWACA